MADGVRLITEALLLPDGARIEFTPMPPDKQFAGIFESSCQRPATSDELDVIKSYSMNVGLTTGPGGTMDAASIMMEVDAAIVRASGAGVFIDNSGLAHGGSN